MSHLEESKEAKNAIGVYKKAIKTINKTDYRNESWRGNLNKLFSQFGFTNKGTGKYASVFINPKYRFAIKVFMKDTAYLTYLNWVIRNQNNKYVPKIRGKILKVSDHIFALRIEKLATSDKSDMVRDFTFICENPDDYINGNVVTENFKNGDHDLVSLCNLMKNNKSILDIHGGNVMMRGKTPVLIDPFYNWFNVDDKAFTMDPEDMSNFKGLF